MSRGHGPLAAFTALAMAGAGLVTAGAISGLLIERVWIPAAGAALLAAGIAVSFAHLGQKRRATLAARGAGRSALSNEVIAASVAAALALLTAVLAAADQPNRVAGVTAGVAGAAFLVSIGLVYRIRGQRTWLGFSALTPLTGGLAFGAVVIQAAADPGAVSSGTLLAVAIDALVFSRRWRDVGAIKVSVAPDAGAWWRHRIQWLGARFFLLDALPFFLLSAGLSIPAAVCAAAGLVVDRVTFYALALPHTTEQEVADVEDLMRSSSDSTGDGV